ncbi:NrdH-redoxin [Aquihabitans sp. G128]|uniref:glutaredoxin domain-containing protein n=1 Tax=Aquihabitans sp. G128 TaxID=2849779 RepID=UPI001C220940|nr:glutaredoxin domain-containing protein [Aquihabitans sp. G128]QXC60010.1 NrdH-redoxin [Aquihabitans sp. G128]
MADAAPVEAIQVYWRPGCPYCSSLLRRLRSSGLPLDERNIWKDGEHAAFVRRHADGNETVPTVAIGDTVLVNPSARTVVGLAEQAGLVATEQPGGRRLRRRR